ncbi:MAG: site-specific integrase [Clostridia bacterium]|nr:site-specific integrase [Clostridia bacterium]
MTNQELEELLSIIKDIPNGENKDKQTYLILKAAADSISKDKLTELTDVKPTNESMKCFGEILKFSKKEYLKMPKQFSKMFRHQGCVVRVYRRLSGKNHYNYEVRFRRDGYNIYASANNLEVAKQKFINKLNEIDKYGVVQAPTVPTTIDGFANYFFENFYKRKVKPETLRVGLNQYKNHIYPHFEKMPLKRITPKLCQELIDRLSEQGKGKTADDVHSLLNMIFKAAVKHNIIHINPLDMVFHTKHEQQHGSALTKDEEKLLLDRTAGTPQQLMFAIALYTGMRPNEYETARLDGDFIIAINSKRKNNKIEYKKIPVTPMLKPYLLGVDEIKFSTLRIMRDRFNKIFPKHKLYDLRTTCYTRCQESGVADVARDEFVGHSLGALGNAYTDLSEEFLLREGNKLNY